MPSITDGMYLFFSIPLGLASLLEQVIKGNQGNPNVPQVQVPTASRQWFSQPRPNDDPTTECVTVNFKIPLSISEVGWDQLRVSSKTEVWYMDRQNNWRQVLDQSRIPVSLTMSTSQAAAWYQAHFYVYPIIAKALQFRITRAADQLMGNQPYCVGLKNALIRRNIYTRSDGTQGIEPQQDPLGNTATLYVKDWAASKAYDNDPHTYWKSMPLPDPNAVANLYLDCRTPGGGSQLIDTLYIDPVYSGQTLNLYYSNDDTQGTLKLSPIGAVPTIDVNTDWTQGKGRRDSSTNNALSAYSFPMNWGPLSNQDAWMGVEWTPDFDGTLSVANYGSIGEFPASGAPGIVYRDSAASLYYRWSTTTLTYVGTSYTPPPPYNPTLIQCNPDAPGGGQWWPRVYYDSGSQEFVFQLQNSANATKTYRAGLTQPLKAGTAYRVVAGWRYDPDEILLSVKLADGTEVAKKAQAVGDLPAMLTFDGAISFNTWNAGHGPFDDDPLSSGGFRGLFTAHVIKLEDWSVGQASFQGSPIMYVSPDPVIPDPSGNIPATTLDNAIFASSWTTQEVGTGGDHESRYEQKQWTPIWQNYFSQKGKMFFPTQVKLKYLKLEFTHLTEEPYPVYDSGINVSYKTFPVSVTQTVTSHHPGLLGTAAGLLSVGADVILQGITGVNWLNPSTINNAVNSVFGKVINPVDVTAGQGTIVTTSLPNTSTLDIYAQTRDEVSSPYVYRRDPTNAYTLAGHLVKSSTAGAGNVNQGIAPAISQVAGAIVDSFSPLLAFASNPAGLPSQGQDWWIFPGGTLRMPAIIMNGLTAVTQTILGRPDTTVRQRFQTSTVHRYDTKTVTRDAAIAYFAGVREVQPYLTTYVAELDPPLFKFSSYDPTQWSLTNVYALDSGPVTTAGAMNPQAIPSIQGISTTALLNGNFNGDLANWTPTQGTWTFDGSKGHFAAGTAKVTATGATKVLLSNAIDVVPGIHYDASVWTQWAGLTAANNSQAIAVEARYFDSTTTLLSTERVGLTNTIWPTNTPETAGNNWAVIEAERNSGTGFTVPANASTMRLALIVSSSATAGTIWFDTVITGTTDSVVGSAYKNFQTTSTFTKLKCTFSDSGVVRSDSMWARLDPNDLNIDNYALAYYTSTIPDQIPAGMWADTFATWGDVEIDWGAPRAVVAINVDPDRVYDGKRVLHFSRSGGTQEAGVKVRQSTNFVANGLFRIGAVFLKPNANTNQVTLRLRRVSDGVYIYQTTFTPVSGYWFEKVTDFVEIPDSEDQEYTVELVLTGDKPDEFYLNDLYVEIASIRYFVRLGGAGEYLHDVTQLRYADSAIVSCTEPVNEFAIQTAILSPKAWAYSCSAAPVYLK